MQEKINILNELKHAGAAYLINADNKNYYAVPDGYFNNLAPGILTTVFIKSLPGGNPYTVPENYFEHLPDLVLEKINLQVSQENIYSVPEGYFSGFAESVLKKIKTDANPVQAELDEISPLLSSISKKNVYSIPEGYFDSLSPFASVNTVETKQAPVISLAGKTRRWLNYAAAASVAAILFIGGYFFVSNHKQPANAPVTASAHVDIQKELADLSDSEIEAYLKENSNVSVFTNVGMDDYQRQNEDIQTLIKNIPDEDIQQYLDNAPAKKEEGI